MKNFLLVLFCACLIVVVLYMGGRSGQFRLKAGAKLVGVEYYARRCQACADLNLKTRRLAFLLAREPIQFITYNRSNAEYMRRSEQQLAAASLLETSRRERGEGFVIIFDLARQKPILRLNAEESLENMEAKIRKILSPQ